ncbi:hypothetical protein Ancab_010758 [Ancistrocladus abbreviatus]
MKQKMVVKVSLNGKDSRCKAMKIAVSKHCGIESIGWKGENQLEVVGDGIDVAKLTDLLRKKVGRTEVVSVNLVDGGGGSSGSSGGRGDGGSGSGGGGGGDLGTKNRNSNSSFQGQKTMKQKMVVKVSLNGEDSRCKAMKTVVSQHRGWKGENQLEVVGDGIDVAKLTFQLRKKVGCTEVVSVNPVDGKDKKDGNVVFTTTDYKPQPACCTIM